MSKTVKFSFATPSPTPSDVTSKTSSSVAAGQSPGTTTCTQTTSSQSTPPQAQNLINGSLTCNKQVTTVAGSPSIQAETGQLRMESSKHSAVSTNASYRAAKRVYHSKGQSPPVAVNACTIAEKMRKQFNHQIHEHVKNVKYELASLHEHLLKLEEEIKLGNKAKNSLETAIQEIRKSISVNQQSISAQQKKRREEVCTCICIPIIQLLKTNY